MCVMHETVHQRRRQFCVPEGRCPLAKLQIGRYDHAMLFVAVRDDVEQQFGTGLAERNVPYLIENEQIHLPQLFPEFAQCSGTCISLAAWLPDRSPGKTAPLFRAGMLPRRPKRSPYACVFPVPTAPMRRRFSFFSTFLL